MSESVSGQPSHGSKTPSDCTEITYLYLTFDTYIPLANTTITPSARPPTPSPPPDLKKYDNPMSWPNSRKYLMLSLSCTATFLTAYTASAYTPALPLLQADLNAPSPLSVMAGITTFCTGFAFAPMVLAPLSEMNGRYPLFVVAGIVYVIFQAVCGLVRTLTGLLVARLLVGIGASVFSTMVGGVIADMWDKEERNTPMALFSGAVLVGTGAGPVVAAVMAHRWETDGDKWKWIYWHQVIMGGALMILLVVLFKESRGSVLLSRKARKLNEWYEQLEREGYFGIWSGSSSDEASPRGLSSMTAPTSFQRVRWLVKEDEERSSIYKMISISVYRPFHLLLTEPVIFFFSLWVAFAWGVLYLTFASIPIVFRRQYLWNIEQAGYMFVAMIVGAILATVVGIWQEQILHHPHWVNSPPPPPTDSSNEACPSRRRVGDDEARSSSAVWAFMRRHFPADAPESRLYFTCLTSTLLPIGLFVFGFTARPEIPWIAPAIGIALATMGILSIYLAVFNYFADTYHKYASSALAAQSFCRNILGGVFPLVTAMMYDNLGEAKAGGLLGAIATALTVVPWVLVFFGERIRARSPFAKQLEKS
ncbi:major facilitator superfamily domain-containing protein [Podospora didyma]|uniref:Major facilitator superfamily domain-containing protein n=1 Tax=Podospora didyma TaxID=330526 RepID=A0AAE0NPN6_9PEZI|nr:major facilitator superfamily domain-containing protein [Podospora didyma]